MKSSSKAALHAMSSNQLIIADNSSIFEEEFEFA